MPAEVAVLGVGKHVRGRRSTPDLTIEPARSLSEAVVWEINHACSEANAAELFSTSKSATGANVTTDPGQAGAVACPSLVSCFSTHKFDGRSSSLKRVSFATSRPIVHSHWTDSADTPFTRYSYRIRRDERKVPQPCEHWIDDQGRVANSVMKVECALFLAEHLARYLSHGRHAVKVFSKIVSVGDDFYRLETKPGRRENTTVCLTHRLEKPESDCATSTDVSSEGDQSDASSVPCVRREREMWLCDTGCGHDLIGRKTPSAEGDIEARNH